MPGGEVAIAQVRTYGRCRCAKGCALCMVERGTSSHGDLPSPTAMIANAESRAVFSWTEYARIVCRG
eukprot:scaffold192727_cov31-Tisochrysis_lutea.AAC.6